MATGWEPMEDPTIEHRLEPVIEKRESGREGPRRYIWVARCSCGLYLEASREAGARRAWALHRSYIDRKRGVGGVSPGGSK